MNNPTRWINDTVYILKKAVYKKTYFYIYIYINNSTKYT